MTRQLRVAVVGAGPAGIYASDILTKADLPEPFDSVSVDILDHDPTPFGLIRYGVAPDHPRIKEIIKALYRVMGNPSIRFYGNVDYGTDLKLDNLQALLRRHHLRHGRSSRPPAGHSRHRSGRFVRRRRLRRLVRRTP